MAFILRGDIDELKRFSEGLDGLLTDYPAIQFVHKHVSASKIFINDVGGDVLDEGGEA